MKPNLSIITILLISFYCFTVQGQITIGTRATNKQDSIEYLYHWDGNDIILYGFEPYFVRLDQNPRVPESGDSFTAPRTNDTFGYQITGVLDWDTESAINAIDNGVFLTYINNLKYSRINKHGDFSGLKLGIGIDNGKDETGSNAEDAFGDRDDRVGTIGEALILTFDTTGQITPVETRLLPSGKRLRGFKPDGSNFNNTGLNSNSALRVSDLHLEPGNVSNNMYRRLDYLIYDASENAILSDVSSDSGMELGLRTRSTSGTIKGTWTIDDGDIIILAYLPPSLEDQANMNYETPDELVKYSWGLWSLKMDLIDKSTLTSNLSNINPTTVLYPNPTSGEVNIQLDKIYNTVSVKLYSIDGRELLSYDYSSKKKLTIDLKSLKNGNYFLMLNLDNNRNTLKVIKD